MATIPEAFASAVEHHQAGRLQAAESIYRQILGVEPQNADALHLLGVINAQTGNHRLAVEYINRALQIRPDWAEALSNLGNALREQGRLDEAILVFQRALQLKPGDADAHNNLGVALRKQGKLDEAVACYRRALDLNPNSADAHINLGNALTNQGNLDQAVASYRRAVELRPNDAGRLGLLVHLMQHLCCWEDLDILAQRMIDVVSRQADDGSPSPVSPFNFLALPTTTTAEQQLHCARQWMNQHLKTIGGRELFPARPQASIGKSKITVGYLSSNFHFHPVACLIAELIEQHDRDRFAVVGYSYGPDDGSPMRQRLVQAFDRFVDLQGAASMESARRIAADGVDILVDLKGCTQNSRTQILALRPAPIQVNFLGYPGTMGAPFMDYILVDDFVVPGFQQPFFTEKLVHLPGCYQVNDSQRAISAQTPSRGECGLPEQGFVFCSFNNNYKITPGMFDVWMELLKAVPGSVLWLLEGNRFAPANLSREAQLRGVAAERLIFAPRQPLLEHLARHRLADLFLDTFPYNAHTTASDALWAGCPVLTYAGETFASRVAGSLLRTLGLPELITTSLDDYQAMALQLARNADLLSDLRTRLAANRKTSGLFSGEQFARTVENAYLTMWEIYASSEKPRPFKVSL